MRTPTVPTWRGHDESWTVDHDSETPKRQRPRLLSAGAIAILASGIITVAAGRAADAAPVGAGSYAETLPTGRELPAGCGTISSNPREFLTANAPAGAVPTNDWWSSLVFKRTDCAYSLPLHVLAGRRTTRFGV